MLYESPACAGDSHFWRRTFIFIIAENTMDIETFKEALALILSAWREASGFFLSIEVWMMLLAAGATVGGAWLALLGSGWGLALLFLAIAYVPARAVLHARRVLSWPFL